MGDSSRPPAYEPQPSNSANGAMLSVVPTSIETASGLFVDLAAPQSTTLRLFDIAQGMSLTCRYGGQVRRFYSVAEHAVLVHDLLSQQGASRDLLLAGLFHDAAEAYLGDVVAPLKYAMRRGCVDPSEYDRLSYLMDCAIADRYGVDMAAIDSAELRAADMWALRIEAKALTYTGGANWRWPGKLPEDGEQPSGVVWAGGLAPEEARGLWLTVAGGLGVAEPTTRQLATKLYDDLAVEQLQPEIDRLAVDRRQRTAPHGDPLRGGDAA